MKVKGEKKAVVVPAGGGVVHRAFGDELTVLLGGRQTGGEFMTAYLDTPPGGGPPLHYHENEDEWFVVLEGRAGFFLDGGWIEGGPGTAVFMPKRTPHTFRNIGETALRMLLQTAPAGFEVFFSRLEEMFADGEPPDMDEVARISAEHGIHFMQPPVDGV